MIEPTPEEIKVLYNEVCRAHEGITDFRAKLLGFLPLASGAAIYLLVSNDTFIQRGNMVHLIPVGLFGILITVGLFFYELRGIHKCRGLNACAAMLERRLLPGDHLWQYGAFSFRQSSLWGFVGATGAALIIYPTVIGAWAYLTALGISRGRPLGPLIVAGGVVVVAFGLGKYIDNRHKRMLQAKLATVAQEVGVAGE
ncbi:MAG TPA: hypothetical protein P5526_20035 [Anaerolineae bacterium]|mgnify:CR=1 FL=1|nr:hypothetical protein [Anaerolineae bacterium]HRV94458.1 hypothetical protein [Anaerolineae bacterium]